MKTDRGCQVLQDSKSLLLAFDCVSNNMGTPNPIG